MNDEVPGPSRRWLVGLRRAWIDSGALESWAEEKGIDGVVWTPAAYEMDDVAPALESLVGAGAQADASLLWDLALTDVQAAADIFRTRHQASDETSGFVVVWLDPRRAGEPKRAVTAARELIGDLGPNRRNVAVGLAWHAKREATLRALVEAGVRVALSGVRDEAARAAADKACSAGVSARRSDQDEDAAAGQDEDAASGAQDPGVFFLGGPQDALCTEFDLCVGERSTGRLPLSPDAEGAGLEAAVERLQQRAGQPARTDAYTPDFFARGVAMELSELDDDDVLEDVWAKDHTIWKDDPTEIADRLGWLEAADDMARRTSDLMEFARKARAGAGIQHVLLCGMGGSVLGGETLAKVAGGGIPLTVLDSTHPGRVDSVCKSMDWAHTLVVVGSKSGTTVETRAHLEYVWSLSGRADRFVAVTDPGTELAELGKERGFLRVFENPPDVGGRFSALTYFGLVPAALAGTDIRRVIQGARRAMAANSPGVAPGSAPAVRLGAAIAEAQMKEDRDKLTLVLPRRLDSLGPWIEQLVAESTGKEGTGVLPVSDEPLGPPEVYGRDRLFCVYADQGKVPAEMDALVADYPMITITETAGVGAEMFRWELATAIVGYLLDVNPFDQPDVEAAKRRAREALQNPSDPDPGDVQEALSDLAPPRYVAIQAFLDPTQESSRRLESVRRALRERYQVAVTVGYGPQFLHSTGQLHKGGPPSGVFLQVTDDPGSDVEVPGMGFSFGQLIGAQADGDLLALREAGRTAVRLSLARLEDAAGVA